MPSFDVVSKVDIQEVKNSIDQTKREISTRYDFKGSTASVDLNDLTIVIVAEDQLRLKAIEQLLKEKLAKRGISLKSVEFKEATKAGGDTLRQEVIIKQGLNSDDLKRLNKDLKSQKFKVTAQIQGDQLRVTGKKRDDLQEVIGFFRQEIKDIELQYINFRD